MADSEPTKLRFSPLPLIADNPNSWGPPAVNFDIDAQDAPYQPFSKTDRLGRVRSDSFIVVSLSLGNF